MADYVEDISTEFFKFFWTDTSLFENFDDGGEKVNEAVMAVLEYKAPQVEAHMKNNAVWEDQTGNARQGLRAQAYDTGDNKGIILYHQVPYGIWLEVKYSGKYGIILPTIEAMGPEVMASLENILGKIRF